MPATLSTYLGFLEQQFNTICCLFVVANATVWHFWQQNFANENTVNNVIASLDQLYNTHLWWNLLMKSIFIVKLKCIDICCDRMKLKSNSGVESH